MFYRVANLNAERNERMMQRHIHGYKQPKRVSTHAWIKHVLSIVQTRRTSLTKHVNKRNVLLNV